jgi:hypothetical protein
MGDGDSKDTSPLAYATTSLQMEEFVMPLKVMLAAAMVAAAPGTTALAQQPAATDNASIKSEPGKATAVRTVEISAQVTGIDKATRTLTLKGPQGDVVDVVASDEVRNFDQIKVGDSVVARYLAALTLELRKTKVAAGDVKVREEAAKAKPGARPAVAGARQVSLVAEVVALDPAHKTISLKGPKGRVVTIDVQNPEQFKVVKQGDQVDVTYTEALALSVEPKAKPAPKK